MNFAVTERGSFRRCRRQAVLTSKNGRHLTPIFGPLNLSVGTIFHRATQLWTESPNIDMHTHALNAAVEAENAAIVRYRLAVGANPSDAELSDTREAIEMAMAMANNYALKYDSPLPPGFKLLATEQKIEVPVPGTEHILEGRLDGLIQNERTGQVAILERKTYKNRPKVEDLRFNDQFLAYIYLVYSLRISDSIPIIAYDGAWRRATVPRGRVFDDLFARYQIGRNPIEVKHFERYVASELRDMAAVYKNPNSSLVYPNRAWTGCWDCKVSRICDAMTLGEDHEGIISAFYTERTDDVEEETEVAE